jgi:RimJ/RimL family protein N-acetyltransferase
MNPFDECPIYETKHFTFKRVCEEDAEDLFICYSDPVTLKHMNNDNCSGEWRPASADELKTHGRKITNAEPS